MTIYKEIVSGLEYLKLVNMRNVLEEKYTMGLDDTTLEIVRELVAKEVEHKKSNSMLYNVKVAGFPYIKTIEEFDFEFQPSLQKEMIEGIAYSNFYEESKNIIFTGSPGVGKTHLAIAIAREVAMKRNAVYFIKFSKLINNLVNAHNAGNLQKRINTYRKYKVLIIDELGFNEIGSTESKLFFQLIDSRYEQRSVIITSNIGFEKWVNIFNKDEMLTSAIIDRLLHHSHLMNISGNSYRIKNKLVDKSD